MFTLQLVEKPVFEFNSTLKPEFSFNSYDKPDFFFESVDKPDFDLVQQIKPLFFVKKVVNGGDSDIGIGDMVISYNFVVS